MIALLLRPEGLAFLLLGPVVWWFITSSLRKASGRIIGENEPIVIRISNLRLRTYIGCNPEEKTKQQDVIVNAEIRYRADAAFETDEEADALNYKSITKRMIHHIENGRFQLLEKLTAEKESLEQQLRTLLLPKDPNDSKNVILEIRAGTGGAEAALFAGDLLRMYLRYAEAQGWQVETISESLGEHGGYKEVVCRISGNAVYAKLKFESGAHRVQRVPVTESGGRIHTSAVSVAVLPEGPQTIPYVAS